MRIVSFADNNNNNPQDRLSIFNFPVYSKAGVGQKLKVDKFLILNPLPTVTSIGIRNERNFPVKGVPFRVGAISRIIRLLIGVHREIEMLRLLEAAEPSSSWIQP